jgi:hypothetical protein
MVETAAGLTGTGVSLGSLGDLCPIVERDPAPIPLGARAVYSGRLYGNRFRD